MSATPSDVRPSKRQRTSNVSQAPLQCQVKGCDRTYERVDHLNRHLDSHRNERSFRCEECPAAFNRKDLLLRHQATHAKNTAEGQIGPDRTAERATKACNACVLSKVKCDNEKPCRRCQKKDITCTRNTTLPPSPPSVMSDALQHSGMPHVHTGESDAQPNAVEGSLSTSDLLQEPPLYEPNPDAQVLLDLYSSRSADANNVPTFFKQIMVPEPDWMGGEFMQPPPDLTTWLPEVEWFGQLDLFGSDFTPTIDQTYDPHALMQHVVTTPDTVFSGAPTSSNERPNDDAARRRYAAFRQSPWLWVPQRNQHAFSEGGNITIDERNIDLASSPHQPYSSNVVIPDRLSSQARDRIFQLVSKTAQSQISIPSFPSPDCLDKLIKVGIAKRTETDAWIHPYTFNSEVARPEFLTALVAAGCVCFGIPSVSRTGLILQEIVRVALAELAEKDNSVTQDLQYLQASMLWIDIGAFCGFRRKMVIAESNLQSLVTSLRRAGRFDGGRGPLIVPTLEDDKAALELKWRQWAEQESYKRLVYHLWEHDIDMMMVKHRQPLLSYAELSLPIPASRSLWLAPSAEVWRDRFMSANHTGQYPSLRTLLQDESAILCLPLGPDKYIAQAAYLHGLAAQIWDYAQQSVLLHGCSDPSSQLWSQSRQQKLYQYLQRADISIEKSPAVTCVFHQFLQMYLHVNLDTISRFAGKCGEEEAHRAYTHLQSWIPTKNARISICHAGQVLRAARAIPPYQLRGPDSFMVYHAVMVLWTYGMMMRDHTDKTGIAKLAHDQQAQFSSSSQMPGSADGGQALVYLDGVRLQHQPDIDAFIFANSGIPCIRIVSEHHTSPQTAETSIAQETCNLQYPSQVMEVGVKLLDATHPGVDRENGPPLPRALCGLMEELGKLR